VHHDNQFGKIPTASLAIPPWLRFGAAGRKTGLFRQNATEAGNPAMANLGGATMIKKNNYI
jgi:hypothetical protein